MSINNFAKEKELIGKAIRSFRKAQDMTLKDFSAELGTSSGYLSEVERGIKAPGSQLMISLKKNYNLDLNSLFDGKVKKISIENNAIREHQPEYQYEDEFYQIPFYASIKASAGGGLIPQEKEPLEIAFRKYFVNTTLQAQANELFAMKIAGDSMAPTLQDDDLVLVDQSNTEPRAGVIMVIRIDETVSCKRIQELPGHRFKIMSDNQAYDSFEIDAEEEGFEILGQVIWFGRSL